MSAYSNPHPTPEEEEDEDKPWIAALMGRGAAGTLLWFAILAALIITFTLLANLWGDDNGDAAVVAAPPPATPTATPAPTPAPAPTPTTTAAAPTPRPTPTAVPAINADVLANIDAGVLILRGVVPDQATADAVEAAAISVLGAGRVVNELTIDPNASAGVNLIFSGDVEEATGLLLIDTLVAAAPGATVSDDMLTLIASIDVVAALNEQFAIEPVQFALGSAEILDASGAVLTRVAAALNEAPALSVEVQGHTDNTGDPASNEALSQARAESVIAFLVDAGVSADRLNGVGFGQTEPVADNSTADGRQANRRIEFEIVA